MQKKLIVGLLLMVMVFCFQVQVSATENEALPLNPLTEEDLINVGISLNHIDCNNLFTTVSTAVPPSAVNLSQSKYFPPIINQPSSACVATAISYYQFTYEKCKEKNIDAGSADNQCSPSFTYNLVNENNGGTGAELVYAVLQDHGCLSIKDFPIRNDDTTIWNPSVAAQREALKVRISRINSYNIDTKENPITSPQAANLTPIKNCLSQNKSVLNVICAGNWVQKKTTNGEEIIVRTGSGSSFHGLTIVGYDETISCDVNENGIIENAEKGAFIAANSWGSGYANNGYVYILFDALNLESQIKSKNNSEKPWDYNMDKTRYTMFGDSSSGNQQMREIKIQRYTPKIMAEVTMNTNARNDISFSYLLRETQSRQTRCLKQDALFTPYVHTGYAFNGTIVFDVPNVPVDTDYRKVFNNTEQIEFTVSDYSDYTKDTSGIKNLSLIFTDIDGTPIIETKRFDGIIENASYKFTSNGICQIGDVDYDGSLTAEDALIILKRVSRQVEFNQTKEILGDFDGDGTITVSDGEALLRFIAHVQSLRLKAGS